MRLARQNDLVAKMGTPSKRVGLCRLLALSLMDIIGWGLFLALAEGSEEVFFATL